MRRTVAAAAVALATSACTHFGTEVTLNPVPGETSRAVDQQVVSDAVDQAFAKLKLPAYKKPAAALPLPPPPPPAPDPAADPAVDSMPVAPPIPPPASQSALLTGYVEVSAPLGLSAGLRDYVASRAAAAAAQAGIGVREVEQILERNPANGQERVYVKYPDTDVKVLAIVAYAGADHVLEPSDLRSPERRGNFLVGRFKMTFAIVPRATQVPAYSEVVSGDSRYPLDETTYFDGR